MIYLRPTRQRFFSPWDQKTERFLARPFETRSEDKKISLNEDVKETKEHILLSFDLPGLDEKDLSVTVRDGVLNVTGERKVEEDVEEGAYTSNRRSFGKFSKQWTLPDTVQSEKIEADYRNGVLRIALPKEAPVEPETQTVPLNSSGEGFFKKLLSY